MQCHIDCDNSMSLHMNINLITFKLVCAELVPLCDPACRKCGTEEETSAHVLCDCEALASLRNQYLGTFFLDPEDIRVLEVGAIWNFIKGTGVL